MAIPPWAVDVLRRGMGNVIDKVPPDAIEQLKKRAGDLFAELPQTAAKGVDSVMRGAKAGRDSLQRWSRRHVALVTPVVNGSGCLADPRIAGVPIGTDAIEVAVEAFQSGALTSSTAKDRLNKRLNRCVGSGEIGVLITSTVDGACLAIANANRGVPIYFHRSQSQRLPSGSPVPDAFGAGTADPGSRIHEVGSVDQVEASDVRGIGDRAILVGVENGGGGGVWFKSFHDSRSPSADLTRILLLPAASLNAEPASGSGQAVSPPLPSVTETLKSFADLIVTPGEGALGGPRCGVIIGNQKRLDAIASSAVWPAVAADVAVQAAMTVTLESLSTGNIEAVPVLAMLATSEDNLRSRAERLATRIAAEPIIRSCQITAKPATLSPAGKWSLPSRQLKLAHRDLSPKDWAEKLAGDVPAVIVSVEDDSILVDLRWIQPVDDVAMVSTLVGHDAVVTSDTDLPA